MDQHIIGYACALAYQSGTGYGNMGRRLRGALERRDVCVLDVRTDDHQRPPWDADICIVSGSPINRGAVMNWHRRWLFTMAETTQVGGRWVDAINADYERVIVPARSLVDIFKDSGVTVPVHFIPLGVSRPPRFWALPPSRDPNGVFRVAGYTLGDTRKGADITVRAFAQAFGDDPNVELVIKAPDYLCWIDHVDMPQLRVVRDVKSDYHWFDFLAAADLFAFPSRGEGYGLPPREAALIGTPVVATKWLGMEDADEWAIPLKYDGLVGANQDGQDANGVDGEWANPSVDALAGIMAAVRQCKREEISYQNPIAVRQYLDIHANWDVTAQSLVDLIEATS